MPLRPKKPCNAQGCNTLTRNARYCDEHAHLLTSAARAKPRESSTQRLYTYKWQKASKGFLARYPLCAEHERQGEVVAATEVDHIVPHKGDATIFWNRNNWQSLCHSCHSRKTAREDGGWGNPRR
ncbi:HNH endonuclease [Pseudomonas ogarae]|uniref:HNH endonuclease n=1 Tax=Pseudomonas ogarae (strain DSM 112162 / CECT 30235 / F113) TaxID=1114970 RepID=UPI0016471AB2|nr:HNH endonuclease [Pseudomonas zarinae]QXH96104.1 HNH endonuclease [Pseudomonas zarinae]